MGARVSKSGDIAGHPMDDFPVRPLDFAIDKLTNDDLVWSASAPEFAVFINALGVHVPYFERYLIRAVNMAKPHVADKKLRRDMVALAGQEGHHARNFIAYNQALARKYPKIARCDADARDYFQARAKTDTLEQMVGFTAGYETFTFLAGLIILRNYERWMSRSHPTLKALWVWHQVEEVEHGAVAHDMQRALYGKREWRRKLMVLKAGLHIAKETSKAYIHMCRVEGWLRNPLRAAKVLGFLVYMLSSMARQTLPVFRQSYNPRHHPLATSKQDPIAVSWREYEKKGGDVLMIDRTTMARILAEN